jgi:palmitoyltransferase ZDHHC13/17
MASLPRPTSADPARAPATASSTSKASGTASPRTTAHGVELNDVQNGPVDTPAVALEEDIMQCARLGEVALLQKMFDSGKFTAQYKDKEGITPLHVRSKNISAAQVS